MSTPKSFVIPQQFTLALAGAPVLAIAASGDPVVSGVEFDSRRIVPGTLFVAMQGGRSDGNRFISAALEQGASAVVTDSAETYAAWAGKGVAIAKVAHGRSALAAISANLFGHPEQRLSLSGVTGTNGKTTTTLLLEQLLQAAGRTTVLAGTIEYRVAGERRPAPHTTPESRDLLELFAEGAARGATEAVMEVSSHGLEQGRVWGLHYDVAIFTNLTRDHLDYHGTMEGYFRAKSLLFQGTGAPPPRVAIGNADSPHWRQMVNIASAAGSEVWTYSAIGDLDANYFATDVQLSPKGSVFTLNCPSGRAELRTRLVGRVNIENVLAAVAGAMARGITLPQIADAVERLSPVPGRFETVDAGQPFTVVVDYAHTDDALRNLLALAREFISADGRVITVFGCGGDRDRTKRPIMGMAAGEGSDLVIATSDNPRSEDPAGILAEVAVGLKQSGVRYKLEPDRAAAISDAMEEARPGDIVLIAGKGHEKTQTFRDRTIPFDDVEEARQALQQVRTG